MALSRSIPAEATVRSRRPGAPHRTEKFTMATVLGVRRGRGKGAKGFKCIGQIYNKECTSHKLMQKWFPIG